MSTVGRQSPGLCRRYGALRLGDWAAEFGGFQRTAVLPDGSGVVFEVTNDLSGFPAFTPELPEKEKGIFFVRADGKDEPRRLGPGTRVRTSVPFLPGFLGFDLAELFSGVSPDGHTIAFTDLGPGPDPDARETIHIWTLDIASRRRTQVTHLREVGEPGRTWTCCPSFLDNGTLSFQQRRYFVEAGLPLRPLALHRAD